jgi:hypothetical protein
MKSVKDHIEATRKRLSEANAMRQAKTKAQKVQPKPTKRPTGRGK